jgi:prepilin-type N-terminal cleavage/methylation domain-containing protein
MYLFKIEINTTFKLRWHFNIFLTFTSFFMKKSISNLKWFTLIELLVTITIIWILAFWASQINFNRLSDKQKSLILSNDVFSSIESVRNNSLLWKWILTWLTTPEKSIINLQTDWSWSIKINYFSWVLSTTPMLSQTWITFWNFSSLSKIICNTSDLSDSGSVANLDLVIEWSSLSLSWCTTSTSWTILDIKTKYKTFEETIRINSISWIMEKL